MQPESIGVALVTISLKVRTRIRQEAGLRPISVSYQDLRDDICFLRRLRPRRAQINTINRIGINRNIISVAPDPASGEIPKSFSMKSMLAS
jgi:hypothetical protein